MGYFRRTIRRSDARRERDTFIEAGATVDAALWSSNDSRSRRAERFVRFAVVHPGGRRVGLFRSLAMVEEDDLFASETASQLKATLRWFRKHLAVPQHLPPRAICWFRADASDEYFERMRSLAELYRMVDCDVWLHVTAQPGRIVYRDRHQIAAIPQRKARVSISRA